MHNRGRPSANLNATPQDLHFNIGALLRALKTTPEEVERTLSKSQAVRPTVKRRRVSQH